VNNTDRQKEVWQVILFDEVPLGSSECGSGEDRVLLFRSSDHILACRAKCSHMGGELVLGNSESTAHCPKHHWELDLRTMKYSNPQNGPSQPQLKVEIDEQSVVLSDPDQDSLQENRQLTPNNFAERSLPRQLFKNELEVVFYSHACVKIKAGSHTIFTDPWLFGPAMVNGWWLKNEPPSSWLEDLCAASIIYISHTHSDHLNEHTLKKLFQVKPEAHFVVPNYDSKSVHDKLRAIGFENILALNFNSWLVIDDEFQLMIMKDSTGREDSCLLIDYFGHKILNLVDCTRPNNMDLPASVDLLLVSFAGGSTGYPICWTDNYSEEHIADWMKKDRHAMLEFVEEVVRITNPKVVMPFAGYFEEAHPDDSYIKERNQKNTWEDFEEVMLRCSPNSIRWYPEPGSSHDVGKSTFASEIEVGPVLNHTANLDFLFWNEHRKAVASSVPISDESLKTYFTWAGFNGPIQLHLVLTDNEFNEIFFDKIIDLETLEINQHGIMPSGDREYIRLKVRSDSFRYIMAMGQPWDEMLIGFQARPYRNPDVYNFTFWMHFQDGLPGNPCDFSCVS
jgi:CMP-N-acetylneuraminate monooxygenase